MRNTNNIESKRNEPRIMGQAFTYCRPLPEVSIDEGFRRKAKTSINSRPYV